MADGIQGVRVAPHRSQIVGGVWVEAFTYYPMIYKTK